MALCGLALSGRCELPALTAPLVLAQTPRVRGAGAAKDSLDLCYCPGSRVVVAAPPLGASKVRVLSEGLYAAGRPCGLPRRGAGLFHGKSRSAK